MKKIILNKKESILVMLCKGSSYIENIEVSDGMETTFENKNNFSGIPFVLEHYTAQYNKVNLIPYREIENVYERLLGDIIFKFSPELFKKCVYEFSGAIGHMRNIYTQSLTETFAIALFDIDMGNVELYPELYKTLKGPFIDQPIGGSING